MSEIKIALPDGTTRRIGGDAPCFIVGEIGTNWHAGNSRDASQAKHLIDAAADAGCDAVKFQTYAPEAVYAPNPGESDYLNAAGIRKPIDELIAERVMPAGMIPDLADHCAAGGLVFMSSCFSLADLGLVDPFAPIHKLASYEISHLRLIDALAATGKPLIMSTGAADETDIDWSVARYRAAGGAGLVLMQCTAAYPAPDESLNLKAIPWLASRFGAVPGLSDHSSDPLRAPLAAVALGAKVIEKHITLDRAAAGPDHFNSLEPADLKAMVAAVRAVEAMLGDGIKRIEPVEDELFRFARRRLQATEDVPAGAVLKEGRNMAILRPGKRRPGAHPRTLEAVEGRRVKQAVSAGDGITPDMVE